MRVKIELKSQEICKFSLKGSMVTRFDDKASQGLLIVFSFFDARYQVEKECYG